VRDNQETPKAGSVATAAQFWTGGETGNRVNLFQNFEPAGKARQGK
jgi:hypothetical protein